MTDFSDQYIEGNEVVHKAPRATLDALLPHRKAEPDPQQRLTREEIEEYYTEHPEEVDDDTLFIAAHLTELTESLEQMRQGQGETMVPFVPSSPIVDNALEILPHLGPDVTAAYIAAKVAGEEGAHEPHREA